jgi:uncharacterized protein (TIGR00661 family)
MRLLYGVTGEGLGHTMRARVLVRHLTSAGHEVLLAASGRAFEILRAHHDAVMPIAGLSLVYKNGGLERVRTATRVVRRGPSALVSNFHAAALALRDFQPDAVVSDFDSFSYAVGLALRVPVISVDHQHILSRCAHPRDVLRRVSYDFPLARAIVRRKLPHCRRYLVSSFFAAPLCDQFAADTEIVGPILRDEVSRLDVSDGEHILVYQTGSGNPRLLAALADLKRFRFVVYGAKPPFTAPHIEYRTFDEHRFLCELASSRAVIANGGHTTLSEAAWLRKPILSVPIRHQGEQELNAAWLEHDGRGLSLRRSPTAVRVAAALDELLARQKPPPLPSGNAAAFRALERALAA